MLRARPLLYRSAVATGLLSLLPFLVATPASAAPKQSVTISFTATVSDVSDPEGVVSGVHVGDVITGSYTYDLTTPDTNDIAEVADYGHLGKKDKKFGVSVNLGQGVTATSSLKLSTTIRGVTTTSGTVTKILPLALRLTSLVFSWMTSVKLH